MPVNGAIVLNLVNNQPTSGSFSFTGRRSFSVNAGDTFTFRVGGSHFDANGNLNGTLTLSDFFAPDLLVTNTANSGAGSLRQALTDVIDGGSIQFDPAAFPGGPANTIDLLSQLSIPNKTLEINARSVGGVTLDANDNSRCIANTSGGDVTLDSMSITGGRALDSGGIDSNAILRMRHCAVFGNHATNSAGGVGNFGGGTIDMANCTLFDKSADKFSGGMDNTGAGSTATLVHCTVFNNTGTNGSGGLGNNGGTMTLSHSVIANNTAASWPDFRPASPATFTAPNFIGNNTDTGYDAGSPNGDGNHVGTGAAPLDPGLLPFGDYGGPTPGMLPRFDSPLIDLGTAGANTPATDQRGFARNVGAAPDLGAMEADNTLATPSPAGPIAGIQTLVQSNGTDNVILRIRERSNSNRCRLNGLALTRLAGQ